MSLRPLCLDCGFQLAAKIGTKIVACILCGSEFDLIKKNQGLDEFLRGKHDKRFGGNEISQQNKEDWK